MLEPGGKAGKRGFNQSEVEEEETREGQIGVAEALRHRVLYLTEEGVLGSERFVNEAFERKQSQLGKRRESGARTMRKADWDGLHVLRDLQNDLLIPTKATLE